MDIIRILIAEDQTLMRHGLKTILDLEDGFEVIGEACDGQEAIERVLALRPDVVLMDVQMPRMTGVEATALLAAALPTTRVIILTTFDYDEYVSMASRPARVATCSRIHPRPSCWRRSGESTLVRASSSRASPHA
jgi:YesN/AraC family two-component response regulator